MILSNSPAGLSTVAAHLVVPAHVAGLVPRHLDHLPSPVDPLVAKMADLADAHPEAASGEEEQAGLDGVIIVVQVEGCGVQPLERRSLRASSLQ